MSTQARWEDIKSPFQLKHPLPRSRDSVHTIFPSHNAAPRHPHVLADLSLTEPQVSSEGGIQLSQNAMDQVSASSCLSVFAAQQAGITSPGLILALKTLSECVRVAKILIGDPPSAFIYNCVAIQGTRVLTKI